MLTKEPPPLLLLSLSQLLSLQPSAERLLRHATLLRVPIHLSLQQWDRTASWCNTNPHITSSYKRT
jgi:hypothetical protein